MRPFLVPSLVCLGALSSGAAQAGPEPARQVSPDRTGNCESPVWSPDRKAIAYERIFVEERRIEINVLRDPVGDAPKEERLQPELDGGGKDAAFQADFADDFVKKGAKGKKGKAAPADGPVKPGQVCRDFAWRPAADVEIYAYSCNGLTGTYELFHPMGTITLPGRGAAGQPAWSPVGWRLAFVSADKLKGDLFLQEFPDPNDPKAKEQAPRPVLSSDDETNLMPAWHPNGKTIAFVASSKRGNDVVVVEDVADAANGKWRVADWDSDELNPSFSPDGTKVAFYSNKGYGEGKKFDIWVAEVGSKGKPFKAAKDVVRSEKHGPAWSPDSRWIVYPESSTKHFDPLAAVEAKPKGKRVELATGTFNNQDPDLAAVGDSWLLTFTASGDKKKKQHSWRKVFLWDAGALK